MNIIGCMDVMDSGNYLLYGVAIEQAKEKELVKIRNQKIGFISAMLHQPQVLILDEPFNFLDPSSQSIIKHLLKAYNEETGATILVSSHNLNHTVDICPRIALLENGKIIRDIDNKGNSAEKELEDYFNVTE